jgi:hypothetical protein
MPSLGNPSLFLPIQLENHSILQFTIKKIPFFLHPALPFSGGEYNMGRRCATWKHPCFQVRWSTVLFSPL